MQAVKNTFPRPHISDQTKKIVLYLQRAWDPFGIPDCKIGLIPPYPHVMVWQNIKYHPLVLLNRVVTVLAVI